MCSSKKLVLILMSLLLIGGCGSAGDSDSSQSGAAEDNISGKIDGGLRVLVFDPSLKEQNFRIYRGDYVRPEIQGGGTLHLVCEALNLDTTFPVTGDQKPYFKVPNIGIYPYVAGNLHGTIEAVDFKAAPYQEVSALEAQKLISNLDPYILDVRTGNEFKSGHIANANLIPVQSLKSRLAELSAQKDRPVFIYCKSGNRSTVASRILINAGFTQVINLRKGINDWKRAGLPLTK